MKTFTFHHRAAVLLLLAVLCLSATAQPRVYVAKYKDNKRAAISYTFDDGLLEHYTELFPVLKRYGIKASFCVNGNTIDRYERMIETGDTTDAVVREKPRTTWAMLREMSDDGQEITSHGWAHRNVKKIDGEELRYELEHNDSVIFQHTGRYPRTFFYPGNAKSDERVAYCSRGRVGTRTRQISFGSKRSAAWMHDWIRETIHNGDWAITMTHGISRGYDHFANPQILFDHFADVQTLSDSLWIGTFHDVSAYTAERDSTTLTVKASRHKLKVTPKTTLRADLFHYPLTLVVEADVTEARQDGQALPVQHQGTASLVTFQPHRGTIALRVGKDK